METRTYIGREKGNDGGYFGGDSRNPTLLLFRCRGNCLCKKAWRVENMLILLSTIAVNGFEFSIWNFT
jgi:hypothetical protein